MAHEAGGQARIQAQPAQARALHQLRRAVEDDHRQIGARFLQRIEQGGEGLHMLVEKEHAGEHGVGPRQVRGGHGAHLGPREPGDGIAGHFAGDAAARRRQRGPAG